jgi:membrane-associated protein
VILAQTTTSAAGVLSFLNPEYLLNQFGAYVIAGLCLVIFIESSIFPVLPGDSLLFTAGLFVAAGSIHTPLWLVCMLVSIAALAGNVVGYLIGYKAGPALFNRPDSRFVKREHIDRTHAFLEKYGAKAIVMARFVPFVRTFITWIAGIGRMDPKRFFTYTVIGGILWAAGVTVLGYFLGQIPFIRDHVEGILVLVIVVSVLPMVFEYLKARREKKASAA